MQFKIWTRGDLFFLLHCIQSIPMTPRLRTWDKKKPSNSVRKAQQGWKSNLLSPLAWNVPCPSENGEKGRERVVRNRGGQEEGLRLFHIYPLRCHNTPLVFDGKSFHFHSFFCRRADRRSWHRQACRLRHFTATSLSSWEAKPAKLWPHSVLNEWMLHTRDCGVGKRNHRVKEAVSESLNQNQRLNWEDDGRSKDRTEKISAR